MCLQLWLTPLRLSIGIENDHPLVTPTERVYSGEFDINPKKKLPHRAMLNSWPPELPGLLGNF